MSWIKDNKFREIEERWNAAQDTCDDYDSDFADDERQRGYDFLAAGKAAMED